MWNARRLVVLVALLAATLFGLWLLTRGSGGPELGPATTEPTVVPAAAATRAHERAETRAQLVAPAASAPASPAASSASALARVRGRCVAAETGEALAGCTVRFGGSAGNDEQMMRHGPVQWSNPATVQTGSDGRFEFAFAPPPPYQHGLDVLAEGRVPRTARWGAFRPGQVEDLGDIALALGFPVAGRVVDTDGNPVDKVGVFLSGLPLPVRAGMGANNERGGFSDASGAIRVDVPVPAGTWPLRVTASKVTLVRPEAVVVAEGAGALELTVVVQLMPFISGVVVDEKDEPIERVYLVAKVPGLRQASAWTRAGGAFRLYSSTTNPEAFRLESDGSGICEPLDEAREFTWGMRDLRLVMRRLLTFEVQVVEDGTGTPVEEFAVVCRPPNRFSSDDVKTAGRFAGGKATVPKTWRGTNLLVIDPKDLALLPNDPIQFELRDGGMEPIVVRLRRMAALQVTVADRAGVPVAGTRLELLEPMGAPITLSTHALDARNGGGHGTPPGQRRQYPSVVSNGETDASGRVTLHALPGTSGLVLRARGPGHIPALQDDVAVPAGGGRLALTVGRGGSFVGQITPPEMLRLQPRVLLRQMGQPGVWLPADGTTLPVAADGTVRAAGIPPGSWDVLLKVRTTDGISFQSDQLLEPPLCTFTLVGDEQSTAELDARAFRPATVRGVVSLDGRPVTGGSVVFAASSGTAPKTPWRAGSFPIDPSGRFRAENLLPGLHRLLLQPSEPGSKPIPARGQFVLAAGADLEQAFHLARQRLRLRLVDADGRTPVANTWCMVTGDDYSMHLTTDQDGWLILDPAPPAAVTVETSIARRSVKLGPAQMPEDRADAELVLTASAR